MHRFSFLNYLYLLVVLLLYSFYIIRNIYIIFLFHKTFNNHDVGALNKRERKGERAAAARRTRTGGVANARRLRRRRSVRGRRDRDIFISVLNE